MYYRERRERGGGTREIDHAAPPSSAGAINRLTSTLNAGGVITSSGVA